MKRVACFIDGFNLYHALDKLGWDAATQTKAHHFKWVDLWKLSNRLVAPKSELLIGVHYFSAFADWLPGPMQRHQDYVKALEATGVNVVLGHFKAKDRGCRACNTSWIGHEEKESDVNIGLWMLNEAYKENYDRALLLTRDSDQKPTVEMILREFPDKEVVVVAPPELGHSNDLLQVATEKRKIKRKQVLDCLLPNEIKDSNGSVIVKMPEKYAQPTDS